MSVHLVQSAENLSTHSFIIRKFPLLLLIFSASTYMYMYIHARKLSVFM